MMARTARQRYTVTLGGRAQQHAAGTILPTTSFVKGGIQQRHTDHEALDARRHGMASGTRWPSQAKTHWPAPSPPPPGRQTKSGDALSRPCDTVDSNELLDQFLGVLPSCSTSFPLQREPASSKRLKFTPPSRAPSPGPQHGRDTDSRRDRGYLSIFLLCRSGRFSYRTSCPVPSFSDP